MRNNTRDLILIAAMATILEVSKAVLSALPNIEVVTLLVFVYTKCFGVKRTTVAVYLFAFIEILIYGFGLWSISYLYIWAIAIVAVRLIQPEGKTTNAILAAIFGLLFGFLCSLTMLVISGPNAAFSWWIAGIPYDLIHALGNFFTVFLLYDPLEHLLTNLIRQYRF